MSKLHIKKGDIVFVNAGEDKGKTGRVLQVLVKIIVRLSKVLMWYQSIPSLMRRILKEESKEGSSIHLSNLNVVDPKSGKATRIGRKLNEKGALVRYSKKIRRKLSNEQYCQS